MGRNSEVLSWGTLLNLQGTVGLGALCPSQLLRREEAAGVNSCHGLHGARFLKEDEPQDSWLPLQGPEGGPFLDTWRSLLFPCPWPDHVYLLLCLFKLISYCLFKIPDSPSHPPCFSSFIFYPPSQFQSSCLANPWKWLKFSLKEFNRWKTCRTVNVIPGGWSHEIIAKLHT